jgi:hypothetical protein
MMKTTFPSSNGAERTCGSVGSAGIGRPGPTVEVEARSTYRTPGALSIELIVERYTRTKLRVILKRNGLPARDCVVCSMLSEWIGPQPGARPERPNREAADEPRNR